MKNKRIISILIISLTLLNLCASAYASVLGSSLIDGYTVTVGEGTTFTSHSYYSDQEGVGPQAEYYITYSPSESVTPIITHGTELWGRKKISGEVSRLSNIVNLTGGINADFFSLQTGVPMSNLIADGKIVSKDSSGQDTIGFLDDGTALISYMIITAMLEKEDGSKVEIHNINKYRQPYAAYLLTEEFSSETHANTDGIDVILGDVEGEMRLGEKITAVVESAAEYNGSVAIPKDKLVITIDKNAPAEIFEPISALAPGEKVSISFSTDSTDPRWEKVKTAMGSVGGRLLINGEINHNLEKGAAPRTAIGIKKDGSVILYTLDGRQKGYSYGAQLTTIAQRLKELGCTDALNLDGGGSTSIVSLLPGDGAPSLRNRPSDGGERGISTFFFLKNNLNPTGRLGSLTFYPLTAYMLTGAKKQFSLKAADTAFHPIDVPDGIEFSVASAGSKSEIDSVGMFTARDSGTVRIKAEWGDVSALMDIVCLETPTDIVLTNQKGERLEAAEVSPGGEFQFTALAYGGYNKLTAENSNFSWSVDADLGTISENGKFTAYENFSGECNLLVSAGEKTVSIPIRVVPEASNEKTYPESELTPGEETNTASLKLLNLLTDKENIIIKADGKALDFELSGNTAEFSYPEGTKYITLYITNIAGQTSFRRIALSEEIIPSPFADTKAHWAENVLGYMYNSGIISGEETKDGLIFRPQKQMNRSEFAVMICNYLELDTMEFEAVSLPFEDIDQIPAWALNATKALYKKGIAKGKTTADGTLIGEPLSPITRAEAATIISRTLPEGFLLKSFSYKDMKDIPDWAATGMKTLMSLGAMNGYTDGTVLPFGLLTKAEAAKLLSSIM